MKLPKNINHKLQGVPIEKRVFIYDASIIIEFLNRTFMPTRYHLTQQAASEVGAGTEISPKHLRIPERYDELFVSVQTMYEYYKLFREQVDYTAPIESRWKFGLIVKKLLLSKNGWQFRVKRVGRAQLWYAGPIELRVKVPVNDRSLYPVPGPSVSTVEVTGKDMGAQDVDAADEVAEIDSSVVSGWKEAAPGLIPEDAMSDEQVLEKRMNDL